MKMSKALKYNLSFSLIIALSLISILTLPTLNNYIGLSIYYYYITLIHISVILVIVIKNLMDKNYTQSIQLIVLAVIYGMVMYFLIFCSIIKMGAIYQ